MIVHLVLIVFCLCLGDVVSLIKIIHLLFQLLHTNTQLEEYLIANRTEYLRHSALNYTAEQKHFNNRLTEGLLELAAKHNYIFDESCFNFVAVRDRIRCYYKSYVQSSKKRGVVVGFPKINSRNSGSSDAKMPDEDYAEANA
mmetsp:Transcript_11567/g.24357  ORF Transcript_11567/g.24357 Transcript_11567/m.24357 type:complete len:142 (+) Transcript_11567:287-712(+)